MDYAAYDEAEQRLVDAVMAKTIDEGSLWIEFDRLRSLVPMVEPAADRERAERSLASLESALNYKAPPMSDELAAAIRVQSQALLSDAAPAERVELLETAIAEIGRIAGTASGAEASRIRHLSEPLASDLEAIRITSDPNYHGGNPGSAD
ncbi:hypothetical protein OHA18_14110 [Kribbella sp. NBC_00709]|uniref:hypothetical protein n=1 Tax=Kribbella sp. NBC_00709 TaxID=2975972 RepID=UPI002E2DE9B0|nr:hypothetical protein [Kribbella sp. NBC_00709]